MKFKALIVGCGAQGKVISTNMARASDVEQIKLSDVSLEVCKQHAAWLKSEKLSVHQVDATKTDQIVSLAKGADVVVNAVIPEYNLNIMDAALKSGAHYLDLAFGPPYENLEQELKRSAKFEDAGLTAITGHGTTPGLTNILAAHATDKLDSVENIFIRICNMLQSKVPISTWSPRTAIEDCLLEPLIFEDGKFKAVAPFSGEETYMFPDPAIGMQSVWCHMHEEPHMLGRTMKDKGLKNCNVKMGALAKMKSLYDQGLLSTKPVNIKGCKVTPWEVVAAALPNPPNLEEMKQKIKDGTIIDSHAVVVVEVTGERGGQKETHVLWSPYASIKDVAKTYPMASHTSYGAGTNGAVLARMLGRGDIKTKGVITPELLEETVRHKYLQELAEQDPPLKAYERVEEPIT